MKVRIRRGKSVRGKSVRSLRAYTTSAQSATKDIGKLGSIKRGDFEWAMGLIEAEGYIGFNVNSGKGTDKEKWLFTIKVAMHKRSYRTVYKLKKIYGVGKIHVEKSGMCVYKITDSKIIREHILPIFDQFPPRGVKYNEYVIFKKGLKVMENSTTTRSEKLVKMRELKEESHKVIEVSPIVSSSIEDQTKPAKDVIEKLSVEHLKEIYPRSWMAGFIEGDGSFQINSRHQIVFEVAQLYDKMAIYALHKIWDVTSQIKVRASDGYTTLSTKHPAALSTIIATLRGEMRGMKSFEYRVWCIAFHTTQQEKRIRAKNLLDKIRTREVKISTPKET